MADDAEGFGETAMSKKYTAILDHAYKYPAVQEYMLALSSNYMKAYYTDQPQPVIDFVLPGAGQSAIIPGVGKPMKGKLTPNTVKVGAEMGGIGSIKTDVDKIIEEIGGTVSSVDDLTPAQHEKLEQAILKQKEKNKK